MLTATSISAAIPCFTWHQTTSLPRPSWRHACAQSRSYLYFLGGGEGPVANCDYALVNPDGTLSDWHATTPLPAVRAWFSADATDNHIYVCGGWNLAGLTSEVYYALLDSLGPIGSWQAATRLPVNLYTQGGIVIDSTLYLVGGATGIGGPTVANVWFAQIRADGSLGDWTATSPLPEALRIMGLVARDSFLYTIGGRNDAGSAVRACYYACRRPDGRLGDWAATTPLPAATDAPTCAVVGDRVYCVGGSSSNAVYSAPSNPDGTIGDWQTETPLPVYRWAADGLAYRGRIYVPGGYLSGPHEEVYYSSLLTDIAEEQSFAVMTRATKSVIGRNPLLASVAVPRNGQWVLTVSDATGRSRLHQHLGHLAQGEHLFSLPGLEPGTYFCQFTSGTDKVLLRATVLP